MLDKTRFLVYNMDVGRNENESLRGGFMYINVMPEPELFERYRNAGLTRYTFDEVRSCMDAANAVNTKLEQVQSDFCNRVDGGREFVFTIHENLEVKHEYYTIVDAIADVTIERKGARSVANELYAVSTATKQIAQLQRAIVKIEKLISRI